MALLRYQSNILIFEHGLIAVQIELSNFWAWPYWGANRNLDFFYLGLIAVRTFRLLIQTIIEVQMKLWKLQAWPYCSAFQFFEFLSLVLLRCTMCTFSWTLKFQNFLKNFLIMKNAHNTFKRFVLTRSTKKILVQRISCRTKILDFLLNIDFYLVGMMKSTKIVMKAARARISQKLILLLASSESEIGGTGGKLKNYF